MDSHAVARYSAAGGVAQRVLIGDVGNSGGEADFRMFSEQAARGGFSAEQISEHWEQARRDVEKDLRSPALKRCLRARAQDFERQLLEMMLLEVHSEPAQTP